MLVYRISKKKYARDLSGEGAKRAGGRWNHPGVPCIYAGASKSISLLEFSAHASLETIPHTLCFTTIEIPDKLISEIKRADLPKNWMNWPHPKASRDFGSKLLKNNEHLVFRFPSAILNDEFIYVINPLHSKIKMVKIKAAEEYDYDVRLKK